MDPNPPSLFYDHQNHRQTHHPPIVVQTRQGVIDLAPLQNHGQNHNVRPVQSYPAPKMLGWWTPIKLVHQLWIKNLLLSNLT